MHVNIHTRRIIVSHGDRTSRYNLLPSSFYSSSSSSSSPSSPSFSPPPSSATFRPRPLRLLAPPRIEGLHNLTLPLNVKQYSRVRQREVAEIRDLLPVSNSRRRAPLSSNTFHRGSSFDHRLFNDSRRLRERDDSARSRLREDGFEPIDKRSLFCVVASIVDFAIYVRLFLLIKNGFSEPVEIFVSSKNKRELDTF